MNNKDAILWRLTACCLLAIVAGCNSSSSSSSSNDNDDPPDEETLDTPTGLSAEGLDTEIHLSWDAVSEADNYQIYYGQSSDILPGHGAVTEVDTTDTELTVTGLTNGTTYYFAIEARTDDLTSDLSDTARAVPFPTAEPAFNDTGHIQCSTGSTLAACPQGDYPGQDAEFGRDAAASLEKFGDGPAGFDFTKLDENGDVLADQSASGHTCVRDNVTGLFWEVKTNDGGLRHFNNTYSWYSTDTATNGGEEGEPDSENADCSGSDCDTQSYVEAVNAEGLCGFSDWRLPTISELLSIAHYGTGASETPRIATDYFPFTPATEAYFWSSTTHAPNPSQARRLDFEQGTDMDASGKSTVYRVRLVR